MGTNDYKKGKRNIIVSNALFGDFLSLYCHMSEQTWNIEAK